MPESKETLAQVFSCEFCEISKNSFFTEHIWTTASVTVTRKQFPTICNVIREFITIVLYINTLRIANNS